jgi:uncharacterized cupin superfamily protein
VQSLSIPGIFAWSQWQPDRNISFASHLLIRESGNVAFDPLSTDDAENAEIEALGGVAVILLTNRDHERGAAALRERFGARILASRAEAELFRLPVDGVFDAGDVVPGITALALQGAKTPGEVAFFLPDLGVAVVGDAVLGEPAGELSFLPDATPADPGALTLSLRRLWALQPRALLLGDGVSLFADVDERLGALLETRGGPALNRINFDELEWEAFNDVNGRYRGEDAEIGFMIGARRLGYRAVRLPAGARYCPMHAHDREEEVFWVIEGEPSIRTPRGTLRLRAGDVMAFPAGDRGTHQLLNESDAPCTVMLLGMNEPDEIAYYPDSQKVLLRRRRLLTRVDRLDYYDGE